MFGHPTGGFCFNRQRDAPLHAIPGEKPPPPPPHPQTGEGLGGEKKNLLRGRAVETFFAPRGASVSRAQAGGRGKHILFLLRSGNPGVEARTIEKQETLGGFGGAVGEKRSKVPPRAHGAKTKAIRARG